METEQANVKVHRTMPHCCSKELALLPCSQHELKNVFFKMPEPINTFLRVICHWWVFDYGVIKGNRPQLNVAVSVCGEIRTSTVGEEFAPPQSEVSLHESERKPVGLGIFSRFVCSICRRHSRRWCRKFLRKFTLERKLEYDLTSTELTSNKMNA